VFNFHTGQSVRKYFNNENLAIYGILFSVFPDAMEKSTIAAVQKVLPLGGRLRLTDVRTRLGRVQRSSGAERRSRGERRGGKESEERAGEEDEEVDLRDVLNKKKEKPSER
jgi:hypothetical protein